MAKWDASEKWYTSCVGERGHYYHKNLIFPKLKPLLKPFRSLLDLGCGQGVLARHLKEDIEYIGIDRSKKLIASARKLSPKRTFFAADVTKTLPIDKKDFECAVFLLSLQNIENGQSAIGNAAGHLKKGAKLILVLNHPCFRIPRQSAWGDDEKKNLRYRRLDLYLSSQKIPIQSHPSQGEKSAITYSYHESLSTYSKWLHESFFIESIKEWVSHKKSEGKDAKKEDRARKEFPLFLMICAQKRR